MNTDEIQLTDQSILEKEFKTAMRGYNQDDVDEFLDMIIQDYKVFQQNIEKLRQENERLKKQTDQENTRESTPNHQTNYDILKRVSNLEKAVFGKKRTDEE